MKVYIVLFRGINVGSRNLLPMKALKSLLENEGYSHIKTYIQSGNVVLKAKSVAVKKLALQIESAFGFKPEILALEKTEFENAIKHNPYSAPENKTIHFYFCTQKPKLNKEKVASLLADDESYKLKGNVFYIYAPSGIARSKLVANVESCLGVAATGRNLNTILKLQEMVQNI